jgi:hypothetical protein
MKLQGLSKSTVYIAYKKTINIKANNTIVEVRDMK